MVWHLVLICTGSVAARPRADLRDSALEIERIDRQIVLLAVEDCAAPFKRIREAHIRPRPLGIGLRDEERLAEEVLQLACACERDVWGVRIGEAVARPHYRQGLSDTLRNPRVLRAHTLRLKQARARRQHVDTRIDLRLGALVRAMNDRIDRREPCQTFSRPRSGLGAEEEGLY